MLKLQQVLLMLHYGTQDTGKLRIGTYTGDLQHGTVYSGGEIQLSYIHCSDIPPLIFLEV